MLSWSFFITKNMKVDLRQTQLQGTIPVLYVFLARAGCTIDSITPVALDRDGNFVADGKGHTPGVKIVFLSPAGDQQTLYYFTSDLADWAIKANPGFGKFCEQQGQGVTLLKAASYLMHSDNFSIVRGFLLAHSKMILQDDSGIPLRFSRPTNGTSVTTAATSGRSTPSSNMRNPISPPRTASAPAPLAFSFGYHWQPSRSSLLIATPK